jgi:hypothetical protein
MVPGHSWSVGATPAATDSRFAVPGARFSGEVMIPTPGQPLVGAVAGIKGAKF